MNEELKQPEDMQRTEAALTSALRRQSPSEGFAGRVLARVAEQSAMRSKTVRRNSWLALFGRPVVGWATAAALSAAVLAGTFQFHRAQELKAQRERAAGEAAKEQLVLALRIAGSKLQLAKAKVNQINAVQPVDRVEKE